MSTPALPGEALPAFPAAFPTPPPMPSIAASALFESRLLVGRTRRVLATLLLGADDGLPSA